MVTKLEEETKKRYDGKTIAELETSVRENKGLARLAEAETIDLLVYLQTTNRYKENKRYAKEPFSAYLWDEFMIRMGSYQEKKRALLVMRAEVLAYGVGIVSKALRVCGQQRAKKAFSEIAAAEAKRTISRDKIDEIIEKNRDPNRKRKTPGQRESAAVAEWHARYTQEHQRHLETATALREARKTIEELESQIAKLKATAVMVSKVRKAFKDSGLNLAMA